MKPTVERSFVSPLFLIIREILRWCSCNWISLFYSAPLSCLMVCDSSHIRNTFYSIISYVFCYIYTLLPKKYAYVYHSFSLAYNLECFRNILTFNIYPGGGNALENFEPQLSGYVELSLAFAALFFQLCGLHWLKLSAVAERLNCKAKVMGCAQYRVVCAELCLKTPINNPQITERWKEVHTSVVFVRMIGFYMARSKERYYWPPIGWLSSLSEPLLATDNRSLRLQDFI